MAKKRKMTDDEIVEMYHPGRTARHERVMRELKAVSEALKRRAEEQRRRAAEAG
jgi:hypothetical protein